MKKTYILFLAFLFLIISGGCNSVSNSEKGFPFDLMVNIDDLNYQFRYSFGELPKIDGAVSDFVVYSNKSNEEIAFVSHQITIYADTEIAKKEFENWDKEKFTSSYTETPDLIFVPRDTSDKFIIRCKGETINNTPSYSCKYLQQHKNLIIYIVTHINSVNITFTEFSDLLQKLDARLPEKELPLPDG